MPDMETTRTATTCILIEDYCDQDFEREDVRMWGVYEADDDGTQTNPRTERDFRSRTAAIDYANSLGAKLGVEVVDY